MAWSSVITSVKFLRSGASNESMNREYHKWYSPTLNREMELLVFGHGGARMIVFPTSRARFFEYEDRSMVAALGDHIESGRLQLFCVDSVDAESFYARAAHPSGRIAVSYTHLRAHETVLDLVCRLLLEKKKQQKREPPNTTV